MSYQHLPTHDRPLASPGFTSFRLRGRYGWIMIGAKDVGDAMREAARSTDNPKRENLQVWDAKAGAYVPVLPSEEAHNTPCGGDAFEIPARELRKYRGRAVVFAFEHTPRVWYYWGDFDTAEQASAWSVGKFPASCGVRIVTVDEGGRALETVNPFPLAPGCLTVSA